MHKSLRLSGVCLSLAGGIALLTLSSNSTGITGQSTAGCSCHGASTSSTLLSITGIPTTGWVAGTAYPLTISVSNSGSSYSRAGFDLTANIGSFSAAGTGAAINGTTEVYHTTPKVFSSGSASWTVTWTAPSSATGTLSFNLAGNAVNNNGATNGDAPNQSTTTYSAAAAAAPTTTTTAATAIAGTTATLNGLVNANNGSTAVTFEWGTTMALGQTATATPATVTGSTATAVSAVLTGLTPATTYHFQVKGVNSGGTNTGTHMTFTTGAATAAPTVTITGAGSTFGPNSANLKSIVNANGVATTISFEWGTTPAYGTSATPVPATASGGGNTNTAVALSGLVPATKYYYRWNAISANGTTRKTDSFRTVPLSVGSLSAIPVNLFPNPANSELRISLLQPPAGILAWVVGINGASIPISVTADAEGLRADISALPAGTYFLLLKGGEKNYGAAFQKR